MAFNKKLIWGGLGWVMGGPIGAILGVAFASMNQGNSSQWRQFNQQSHISRTTKPNDFVITILVLFAKVMKADGRLLKSELDYVKKFLIQQFGLHQAREFMIIFKDILNQEYPLKQICLQIQRSMDHPSRLELIHILFGLSASDKDVHIEELKVIQTIANYLNINSNDFESLKAIFATDHEAIYRILEIRSSASDNDVKKAFRKMANKYHPDKVAHLGIDRQNLAEEKFKAVNEAYQKIKDTRGIS